MNLTEDQMLDYTLRRAIGQVIAYLEGKDKVLSDETRTFLINDLNEFVQRAAAKFINGQIEHGGNIQDRNLDREIDQELFDLFHYHSANKRKNKCKK